MNSEEKIEKALEEFRYRITQFGDWKLDLAKKDIQKLINQQVLTALEEVKSTAKDIGFGNGVMVDIKAIEQIEEKYK